MESASRDLPGALERGTGWWQLTLFGRSCQAAGWDEGSEPFSLHPDEGTGLLSQDPSLPLQVLWHLLLFGGRTCKLYAIFRNAWLVHFHTGTQQVPSNCDFFKARDSSFSFVSEKTAFEFDRDKQMHQWDRKQNTKLRSRNSWSQQYDLVREASGRAAMRPWFALHRKCCFSEIWFLTEVTSWKPEIHRKNSFWQQ